VLRDDTAGDPISGVKWTHKPPATLSRALRRQGGRVGRTTVRRLLRERGYALRVNRKGLSRRHDPHRDRQLRSIARQRRAFLAAGAPVISVETKKQELVGNSRNAGRTWRRTPLEVRATDFPSDAAGKAIPYGVYDPQHNTGDVAVGTSHETAEFAVATIRAWWHHLGRRRYGGPCPLVIRADGGGANSDRSWRWKAGRQALADEFTLPITVLHYPPGASKGNPIEPRLFSPSSQHWAGPPLVSYEATLKFLRTTKTTSGFRCRAPLDQTAYETGLKMTALGIAHINLVPHRSFPAWNSTLKPHPRVRNK
jgi:hypothetical protein